MILRKTVKVKRDRTLTKPYDVSCGNIIAPEACLMTRMIALTDSDTSQYTARIWAISA